MAVSIIVLHQIDCANLNKTCSKIKIQFHNLYEYIRMIK